MNDRDKYDIALIKVICADKSETDHVSRVIRVLVPTAEEPFPPETRVIARQFLAELFDNGEISCPMCGARDEGEAMELCFGGDFSRDDECPVGPDEPPTL